MELYPLKFSPIYKNTIWGGTRIQDLLNRTDVPTKTCGESWELSAVEGQESVVINGFLKGNTISEIIEIYMDEIVGEHVFEEFGLLFPLLFKFIDSEDILSLQAHPNNEVALEKHKCYGKTEMWYVMHAEKNSSLFAGVKKDTNKEEFRAAVENKNLSDLLQEEFAEEGDVFFLPSGQVHSIGKGFLIAEVQQTSDITYRLYDWDRLENGVSRELHLNQALDIINYSSKIKSRVTYTPTINKSTSLVSNEFFTTNLLIVDSDMACDYYSIDSFVVYMCVEGSATIVYGNGMETISKGETVLLPACLSEIKIKPITQTKILEVYIHDTNR